MSQNWPYSQAQTKANAILRTEQLAAARSGLFLLFEGCKILNTLNDHYVHLRNSKQ